MKKGLKIFLIVLGAILAGTLIFALINIKSILLAFGHGKLDVKGYESVESSIKQSELYTAPKVQEKSGAGEKSISCSTKDGVLDLVIQGSDNGMVEKVDAKIHGEALKDVNPTDVNALAEKAKAYMGPIIDDDQVLGLSGFVAKEALAQYRQGKTQISIQQDFDGVYVSIEGNIETSEFTAELRTKPN